MEDPLVKLRKNLREYNSKTEENPYFKTSAVLVGIIPYYNNPSILMTARSTKLSNHSGEMSFPGGRYDTHYDTSIEDTALRETREELGIQISSNDIVGTLDDLPTITGYCIRPFVAILQNTLPLRINMNKSEVEAVIEIPLSFLFDLSQFQEKKHNLRGYPDFYTLHFDFYSPKHKRNFHIWGASAHIIKNFLQVGWKKELSTEHYYRPDIHQLAEFIKKHKNES